MLIHTTQYARRPHTATGIRCIGEVRPCERLGAGGDAGRLRDLWETEERTRSAAGRRRAPGRLRGAAAELPEGHRATRRSSWTTTASDERSTTTGGHRSSSRSAATHSRAVSRSRVSSSASSSGRASAYDTLLQMGRWFGYRGGYADLPRIWMTAELRRVLPVPGHRGARDPHRRRALRARGPDPRTSSAVRVRTHPKLAITSALEDAGTPKTARCRTAGDGSRRSCSNTVIRSGSARTRGGRPRLRDAPAAPRSRTSDVDGYLCGASPWRTSMVPLRVLLPSGHPGPRVRSGSCELHRGADDPRRARDWNVGIVTRRTPMGLSRPSAHIRSRWDSSTVPPRMWLKPHANIKSLMSHEDRVLDLVWTRWRSEAMQRRRLHSKPDRPRTGLSTPLPDRQGLEPLTVRAPSPSRGPRARHRRRARLSRRVEEGDAESSTSRSLLPLGDEWTRSTEIDPDDIDTEANLDEVTR